MLRRTGEQKQNRQQGRAYNGALFAANRQVQGIETRRQAIGNTEGQALIELVLVLPMLFLLIVLAMNFGGLINAWVAVENATRAAADYAVLGGVSATLPTPATSGSLQTLITAELRGIPGLTNIQACVRENDNNLYTTVLEMPSGACGSYSNPPADGEPIAAGSTVTYANLAVDVTCTYTSFFSGASVMGLSMPLLPSSIHRRTVMRILQ